MQDPRGGSKIYIAGVLLRKFQYSNECLIRLVINFSVL